MNKDTTYLYLIRFGVERLYILLVNDVTIAAVQSFSAKAAICFLFLFFTLRLLCVVTSFSALPASMGSIKKEQPPALRCDKHLRALTTDVL